MGIRWPAYKNKTTDQFLLCFTALTLFLWLFGIPRHFHWNGFSVGNRKVDMGERKLGGPKALTIAPIPRIQAGSMTVTDFFEKFRDKPVIIEGEVRHHPAFNMTFADLQALCGGALLETAVYAKDSENWAGLTHEEPMDLATYIDAYLLDHRSEEGGLYADSDTDGDVDADGEATKQLRYASGGSGIPEVCPALQLSTPVPSYASLALAPVDHFVAGEGSPTRHRIQQGQPEIFIGGKGTKTEIHMDQMLIPFWMSVYKGAKTFRTVTFEDSKKELYYYDESDGRDLLRFERQYYNKTSEQLDRKLLEIWNPDLNLFPELAEVTVFEGTVRAGDWIYLPSATLHGVYNEEPSFAISVNALPVESNQISRFLDACAETSYSLECKDFVVESAPCTFDDDQEEAEAEAEGEAEGEGEKESEKLGKTGKKKEALKRCLFSASKDGEGDSSSYVERLQRLYREGKSRDMYLYEIAGYSNYNTWCEENCKILQRILSKLIRLDIEAMGEEEEGEERDLAELQNAEDFGSEDARKMRHMAAYACGQCKVGD